MKIKAADENAPDPISRTSTDEGVVPAEPAVAFAPVAEVARLGRYLVLDELGSGGMGVVYAARDPELDRHVAIKLLREPTPRRAGSNTAARARLLREGRAMAKLVHPNVIRVYDIGVHDDQVFVAMELIDGGTLRDWQREQRRDFREVLAVYTSAGRGLVAAHRAGIVHRDFKPANVLLAKDGRVVVTDFGIARLTGDDPAPSDGWVAAGGPSGEVDLTRTGAIIGTPEYMSPELLRGEPVDERSDQFAFCVALYEGLYGERPFAGPASETTPRLDRVRLEILSGQVRPAPRGSSVPSWVREHVLRGLRLEAGKRFPSMEALLAALAADPAHRRRRVAVGLAAVALVGIAAWGLLHGVARPAAVCGGAEEQLAGAWDAAARARVDAAFAGSKLPFARATFARAAGGLDGFAGKWAAMRTETCRATRVHHEQSEPLLELRVACLEHKRSELAATVQQLAAADDDVVTHAVEMVARLEPLAACADAAALQAEVPAPTEPALAERVKALRARLDSVNALQSAGKYQESLALAKPLVQEADATGFAPLRASAHFLLGRAEAVLDQFDAANTDLNEAIVQAGAARSDRILGAALLELARSQVAAQKPDSAALSAQVAEAVALRDDGSVENLGQARLIRAKLLHQRGQVAEAMALRSGVLTAFEHAYGVRDRRIIYVLTQLAQGARTLGHFDDAKKWSQRALELTIEIFGDSHPMVATALDELGTLALARSEYRDAILLFERALAVSESVFGPDHITTANILHNLATSHFYIEEMDQAIALEERVLRITEKSLGSDHVEMAKPLSSLAQFRSIQGHPEQAIELTTRAADIELRANGPHAPGLIISYGNLAQFYMELGKLDKAREWLQKSIELVVEMQGKDSDAYGARLNRLARLDVAQHRCADAMPRLAEGIRLIEKYTGKNDYRLKRPLELTSRCLIEAGRVAEAFPVLERTLQLTATAGGEDSDKASTRLVLAMACWAKGDRKRARAEAASAEAAIASNPVALADADKQVVLKEIRAWRKAHP